ncbi:unnamed protein product [Paramecium sonneborni]|uniref:Transmembrane protein n=1 Tax=Paramecium sonneborni TaxID=65129 RepID=A0A8S1RIN8_9CILI|nr:unnamed protein product [Paramecium sonneborni]
MMIQQIILNVQNVITLVKNVPIVLKKMLVYNVHKLEYLVIHQLVILSVFVNFLIILMTDFLQHVNYLISLVKLVMDHFHLIVQHVINNIDSLIFQHVSAQINFMILENYNAKVVIILVKNVSIIQIMVVQVCSLVLNFRVLKGNFCQCIDGYYEESGLAECKKCSYKCQTCETMEDKCLTCPINSCLCSVENYMIKKMKQPVKNATLNTKLVWLMGKIKVLLGIQLQIENQNWINANVNSLL